MVLVLRIGAAVVGGMAALVGPALATGIVDWDAVAAVHASATAGWSGETDSCNDSESYTGAGVYRDTLLCEATAGYGHGSSSLTLQTSAPPEGVFTEVSTFGGGEGYNISGAGGSGWSDFDQSARIDVDSPASLHLAGTLDVTDGSSATLVLRNAGGVLVEYVALVEYEPVSFDESVLLGTGDHELILSLRCRPRSDGPHGQNRGGVSASFSAGFMPSVGVETSGWGRIKGLYR